MGQPPETVVGESVARFDGVAKVTGSARYVDDLPPRPGELWGATVRSQVARARLEAIDLDPSFDWSDVTVVTAADIADNVVQLIVDDQPILAHDRIQHRYEPLALVACADRAKLARALAAVTPRVQELEPIFDPLAALGAKDVIWERTTFKPVTCSPKGAPTATTASAPSTPPSPNASWWCAAATAPVIKNSSTSSRRE